MSCCFPASDKSLELSVIVPVFNEIEELPEFFSRLAKQRSIRLEIIVVDGGSSDGTLEWLHAQRGQYLSLRVISAAKGRGSQLNAGASVALAPWFLFLHVDSRFDDQFALRISLDALCAGSQDSQAGHFPLSFRKKAKFPSFAYYFYEAKTATGRVETIHGDQGFLVSRSLYAAVGPFSESLPVMEDTEFAERLRSFGQWVALPAVVSTSARRFEVEGLWQRQLLGALLMCFRAIGWDPFFCQAREVYRTQDKTGKLKLSPYFYLIQKLLAAQTKEERSQIWGAAGRYVRRHAWQIFFSCDCFRGYLGRNPPHKVRARILDWCEPVFDVLTDNRVGYRAATILLQLWFYATAFILSKLES